MRGKLTENGEVKIPLDDYFRELAEEIARVQAKVIIEEHAAACPARDLPDRVKALEARAQTNALGLARQAGLLSIAGAVGGAIFGVVIFVIKALWGGG